MADVTSAYNIAVKADLDATTFQSGAQQAETAMQDLATTTQTAATDIDTALATDVPASVDASAVELTTKASKFKAVGTELGTNLAGGIGSGASGPEAIQGTVSSLSGLLASVASTPAGIVGSVGVGLGVAFVGSILAGVQKSRQDLADATQAIFEGLELTAKTSLQEIRHQIISNLSIESQIGDLAGGDVNAGFEIVRETAEQTGVPLNNILSLLQHGITPATHDTYNALIDARDAGTAFEGGMFRTRLLMDDAAKNADTLLGHVQDTDVAIASNKENASDLVGYLADDAFHANELANNAERAAAATSSAAASAQTLASAIGTAARQSLGIRFNN